MSIPPPRRRAPQWVQNLLDWFDAEQRPMPWRDRPEPYRVWISEMMLQQTQVATVIPYFGRFMRQFPTVHRLAEADLQAVLKAWEGLGYYSRARNLHKAARMIVSDFGGRFPEKVALLKRLPGVGDYAAAAVASIAFNTPCVAVDGNVVRVYARLRAMDGDSTQPIFRRRIRVALHRVIPKTRAGDFNQAMMELGATVCRPRTPLCEQCPIGKRCLARARGVISQLPRKPAKRKRPHYDVVVGIVFRRGQVLIARRTVNQMLAGLWEFPGGKVKQGERYEHALVQKIKAETGVAVTVGARISLVQHAFTHLAVTLHVFRCSYRGGNAVPLSSDVVKWVSPDGLSEYPFSKAMHGVIAQLQLRVVGGA